MNHFTALLRREFRLFWTNRVLRLLFIGAPLMYGILIGYAYKKGKVTDLPILVVDADQSSLSRTILKMMEDNEVLSLAAVMPDASQLNRKIIETQAACVVMIPKDFEKAVLTRKSPEITTIVNTANVLTANYASGALQLVLGTFKAGTEMEALRKQGVPESMLLQQYEPFKTTFIKKNNRATNYMYFLWPGILATVLQQVLLLGLALSFASEFENNNFKELISRCSSTFMLILVKLIPYLIMSMGIWGIYLGFTLWFRIPLYENILPLTWIAGVFVLAVSFIGILVSILIPSQLKATEVLMVIATPSFILSGFTWPLSQMPLWIQCIAQVIPLTHFLPVFRILMVERGPVDLTYPYVINLGIIAFIGFIVSYIALSRKIRKMKTIKKLPGNKQTGSNTEAHGL